MLNADAMSTITPRETFSEALRRYRENGGSPLVVCDSDGGLLGVVGDAELRGASLRGLSPGAPVKQFMNHGPLTASENTPREELTALLAEGEESVVCLDGENHPCGIVLRSDVGAAMPVIDTAVLMVGGEGKRLMPLTQATPKPLLPIAGRPILEHIVERLAHHKVRRVIMALGYLADQIQAHFGDGERYGIKIEYVREERPLGTAGAIGMVGELPDGPLLVMNGDILTDIDLDRMALAHRRAGATLSIATRPYQHVVPYGVFRLVDHRIVSLEEKPQAQWWANAGIYLVDADLARTIPGNSYLDMTVMVERVIADGALVNAFPILEYWCDIGLPEDYERAEEQWRESR